MHSSSSFQLSTFIKVLLLFLFLTLLMLIPVLPVFSTAIAGGPVARRDAWQNVWNLWWVQQAITTWHNPFVTPMLYYPQGADLALQTLNVTNGLLVSPVTALWGPVAGYNTALILGFVLTGLGAYALALELAKRQATALLSACLFTFSPFHITKLWDGQLELIAMQWLPLYALFLLRNMRYGRWRDGLLAGLCLALIGYTSWYYFLFSAVYSVLFVLLWLGSRARVDQQIDTKSPGAPVFWQSLYRQLSVMVLAALTAAVLLLPVLLPALQAVGVGQTAGLDDDGPNAISYLKLIHSADLIDPWLPSALHPVWGQAVSQIGTHLHPYIAAWNIALGYVALLLAIMALLNWRQAWRWWLLFLAGLLLALGPQLQINGVNTGIVLPYAWLTHIPGVDIAHRPSHFIVITLLALVPLAALGLDAILDRLPQQTHWPVVVSLAALAYIELIPPHLTVITSQPHPYYQGLAGQSGAVMDLPPRLEASEPLEAQLIHGLPMMGGFVSRTPAYPFAAYTPIISDLWAMQAGEDTLIASGKDDPLAILNTLGIAHLLIHWDAASASQQAGIKQVLATALPDLRPVYEDATFSAYRIPEARPQALAFFRKGWYKQESESQRRWRWMTGRGEIAIINPYNSPLAIQLTLSAQSYAEISKVSLTLNGSSVGIWQVNRGRTTNNLRLLIPPGESQLWLEAAALAEQPASGRMLSIVIVDQHITFDDAGVTR